MPVPFDMTKGPDDSLDAGDKEKDEKVSQKMGGQMDGSDGKRMQI
jgi:hypothetical protein